MSLLPALAPFLLAAASSAEPRLDPLSATATREQVLVSFHLAGAFSEKLTERIQSGLATSFVYRFELLRDRKHWWDDHIATSTFEVTTMYNAISHEYLVNYKLDGRLVESRLARSRGELEAAMTTFERLPVFSVADRSPGTRVLVRARAELGSRTLLSIIPVHVATPWATSKKFRVPREAE
ncbi:MAG TPA: DUF4390 domain-containing protein [Thermoanaerobaculia bacterium]|nr:DUF4390 domain-containing protein [Thermoanaerobaculia bacterium]